MAASPRQRTPKGNFLVFLFVVFVGLTTLLLSNQWVLRNSPFGNGHDDTSKSFFKSRVQLAAALRKINDRNSVVEQDLNSIKQLAAADATEEELSQHTTDQQPISIQEQPHFEQQGAEEADQLGDDQSQPALEEEKQQDFYNPSSTPNDDADKAFVRPQLHISPLQLRQAGFDKALFVYRVIQSTGIAVRAAPSPIGALPRDANTKLAKQVRHFKAGSLVVGMKLSNRFGMWLKIADNQWAPITKKTPAGGWTDTMKLVKKLIIPKAFHTAWEKDPMDCDALTNTQEQKRCIDKNQVRSEVLYVMKKFHLSPDVEEPPQTSDFQDTIVTAGEDDHEPKKFHEHVAQLPSDFTVSDAHAGSGVAAALSGKRPTVEVDGFEEVTSEHHQQLLEESHASDTTDHVAGDHVHELNHVEAQETTTPELGKESSQGDSHEAGNSFAEEALGEDAVQQVLAEEVDDQNASDNQESTVDEHPQDPSDDDEQPQDPSDDDQQSQDPSDDDQQSQDPGEDDQPLVGETNQDASPSAEERVEVDPVKLFDCSKAKMWSVCTRYGHCAWRVQANEKYCEVDIDADDTEMMTNPNEKPLADKFRWKLPNYPEEFPRKHREKFFVYQPSGGLNNQRRQLEHAMVVARLTNRTCVVPPSGPHTNYFNNYNNIPGTRMIPMHKLLNFEELSKAGPIVAIPDGMSHMEWYESIKEKLSISVVIRDPTKYKKIPTWNERDILKKFAKLRHDVLYFAERTMWGTFDFKGQLAGFKDRKIVKSHMMYEDAFKKVAIALSNEIGAHHAIHVRRGDKTSESNFKNVYHPPSWFANKIAKFKGESTKVYVATDEMNRSMFSSFKDVGLEPLFAEDLREDILQPFIKMFPSRMAMDVLGVIEQLICTYSVKFLGSNYSTFTHFILRMRKSRQTTGADQTPETPEQVLPHAIAGMKSTCDPLTATTHVNPC